MKSGQTMFFALIEDWDSILKSFEAALDVHYYRMGLMDSEVTEPYSSIFDVPNMGFVLSGDWNRVDAYLVSKIEVPLNIRTVPQRSGGMKYAIDQRENPKSVELKLGGIYQEKGNVIVAGRIATVSEDEDSFELFNLISSKIKREFRRIDGFYVGKSAQQKLQLGWRLVTNEKFPKEYDLREE